MSKHFSRSRQILAYLSSVVALSVEIHKSKFVCQFAAWLLFSSCNDVVNYFAIATKVERC